MLKKALLLAIQSTMTVCNQQKGFIWAKHSYANLKIVYDICSMSSMHEPVYFLVSIPLVFLLLFHWPVEEIRCGCRSKCIRVSLYNAEASPI